MTAPVSPRQLSYLRSLYARIGEPIPDLTHMSRAEASRLIDTLRVRVPGPDSRATRRPFAPRTCAGDPCECDGMQTWGECVRA